MATQPVLYGTRFCHLCDEAEAILQKIGCKFGYVDISEDEELIDRYGTRIPVLKHMDTGTELNWPFTEAEARRFFV